MAVDVRRDGARRVTRVLEACSAATDAWASARGREIPKTHPQSFPCERADGRSAPSRGDSRVEREDGDAWISPELPARGRGDSLGNLDLYARTNGAFTEGSIDVARRSPPTPRSPSPTCTRPSTAAISWAKPRASSWSAASSPPARTSRSRSAPLRNEPHGRRHRVRTQRHRSDPGLPPRRVTLLV